MQHLKSKFKCSTVLRVECYLNAEMIREIKEEGSEEEQEIRE